MPWLNTGDEVEVRGRARLFWQLEWADYTTDFLTTWEGRSGVPVDSAAGGSSLAPDVGHRVVRRLRVVEQEIKYPGLTYAAAVLKAQGFFADANYMGAEVQPNGAGGWAVVVTERLYDPEGWSNWIDEAALPSSGESGIESPSGGGD